MTDTDILRSCFSGEKLEEALKKYASGIPAAYIIGKWEFFGDEYYIDENCLIPRCDTERTVEALLSLMKDGQVFADLCTGSGCIAISVLKRMKTSRAVAVDISWKALEIAKKNAIHNGVSDRIKLVGANVFEDSLGNRVFDYIVSNPPYISSDVMKTLDEYVKKEPAIALDGGKDGMDYYRHIVPFYQKNLSEKGAFIFEIGYDQSEAIRKIAKENGFSCVIKKDYSGQPRVAVLQKNNSEEL